MSLSNCIQIPLIRRHPGESRGPEVINITGFRVALRLHGMTKKLLHSLFAGMTEKAIYLKSGCLHGNLARFGRLDLGQLEP
jgi:hypothetical protein